MAGLVRPGDVVCLVLHPDVDPDLGRQHDGSFERGHPETIGEFSGERDTSVGRHTVGAGECPPGHPRPVGDERIRIVETLIRRRPDEMEDVVRVIRRGVRALPRERHADVDRLSAHCASVSRNHIVSVPRTRSRECDRQETTAAAGRLVVSDQPWVTGAPLATTPMTGRSAISRWAPSTSTSPAVCSSRTTWSASTIVNPCWSPSCRLPNRS